MDITSATFVAGVPSADQLPSTAQPEVAFVGRSNVGKSSLINALLRRKNLARTSASPGKTREFNFYLVNDAIHLVDLPGLGYAKVSRSERNRWARNIRAYLASRAALKLLFHLVDGRHGLMKADDDLIELYRGFEVPVVVILTKMDKLSGNERSKARRRVEDDLLGRGLELPIVSTSSRTGRGREEVLRWLELAVADGN